MRVILASKSPRRKELLGVMGIEDFEIIPAVGEENDGGQADPAMAVKTIAEHKALEVKAKCEDGAVIIAADTLVYIDGQKLGKPKNEREAELMLKHLSGRRHSVYSGLCVICGDKISACSERTDVYFKKLSDEEIAAYIRSGEPMDKAGAYGAQSKGCIFVEKIDGDFFNVMGLPVCRLNEMLNEVGYKLPWI